MHTRSAFVAMLCGGISVFHLGIWWKYRQLTPGRRKRMRVNNPRLVIFVRHPAFGLIMGVFALGLALAVLLLPPR